MKNAANFSLRRGTFLLLAVLVFTALRTGPAHAWKVYVNPSIQTNNTSPDGTYNEGYSMQDVADRLMTKLTNRGFSARNSNWLSLSGACNDAVSWDADAFLALHTNATGSGWNSARGTEGFYYTSSSGWYDPVDRNLTDRCVHKCVEKFSAWGRGYDRGTFGDYPRLGYNLYVLSHTPGMNSTLIEGLFHTNYDDTQVLKSTSGKDAYAQACFEAVCDFYGWSYGTEIWNSAYNAQSYDASMAPGQQVICWVEYRNTGNTTWQIDGTNPVRLGTSNPQDRSSAFFTSGNWISANRPTAMDSATCAPNEVERFTFIMTGPSPGTYTEYWRLVSEGKTWFGDSGVHFNITVTNPKGSISGKVTNANNGTALSGATVSLNTGSSTTTDSSGNYSFANLDPATYTVTASRSSYNPNSASAVVTAGNTTTCNIPLTPSDTQDPSVPTGVAATGLNGSQIRVTWTASTDNVGVTGYNIFRNGSKVGSSAGTSYTDSGLIPMTTYSYRVSAYDAVGNESAQSSPVEGSTLSGIVAVFTDGFASLGNWTGDPDSSYNLSLDGSQNHGSLSGANSAKATAGQSRFMYHSFSPAFATGKYEGWFYDSATSNSSRQGIHARGYNASGGLACSFYLGTYSAAPGSYSTYSAGVYNGSSWTWSGQVQERSIGWHKFTIEVLPYTGSGDVKFYIDDALKATMDRPANSNSFGFSRIHIGHNYNVNQDGWFDDIAVYSQAPNTPGMGLPVALGTGSIRWNIVDNSNNKMGTRLLDAGGAVLTAISQPNLAYIDETGLSANTPYTRKFEAFNGTLDSWPSPTATRYTLSVPPSTSTVACNRAPGVWYSTPTFIFSAVGGFGPGKVEYYRWVFDQNPTHTWDGTESVWNNGDLICNAGTIGDNWYLHVQGFNAEDIANGTLDFGPFYQGTPIVISDVTATNITQTSATITWTTDVPSTSQVEYGPSTGYGFVTSEDTNLVTSHSVVLSELNQNTTYHFRVKSSDSQSRTGTSADYTFLTEADITPPGPPTGITVAPAGVGGQINLSWTNPTDPDFSYIRIYRSTVLGDIGNLVFDNEVGTSKQDAGLTDGTTYFYTLKAVDHAGNESTNTDQYSATPYNPLSAPAWLNAAAGATSVSLSWGSVPGASIYNVYRSTTSGGQGSTPLASGIAGTTYTDSAVSVGTTYYYIVRAVLGTPGPASPEASAVPGSSGLVAVFTDGFENLNNWVLEPGLAGNVSLTMDGSRNHGSLPGGNSAKTALGSPNFMYHAFSQPFATGKYEVWFYDASANNSSRQGIHMRGYSGTGSLAFSFYLGTYSSAPGSYGTYSAGVYNGSAWTWTGQIQNRSIGWHKFTIEALPYTGSSDVKFYIDDVLKATMNRPSNSDAYGISRIYIGHNYNVNQDGWFDDAAFYSQTPIEPAMSTPQALADNSIRWNWVDNSNNEMGFRLQNGAGGSAANPVKNSTSFDETSLVPNTLYVRRIKAYNGTLESGFSGAQCYSLSVPPSSSSITCNRNINTPYKTPLFEYTAVGGFGPGKVQYYRYAFDQNPTCTFTGSELNWSIGTLTCEATTGGSWYLHVQGYNAENVPNGTLDMGPFIYDGTAPAISDVEASGITQTGATITWTTDEAATSQVEYGTTTGYGLSTVPDANLITAHSVVLSNLTPGTTCHYRVRSTDAAGNEAVSGDYIFNTAGPLQTFSAPENYITTGWTLFSLPATPVNPDPLAVLNQIDVPNSSLQYWQNDSAGGGYQNYGELFGWTGPLQAGTAYWLLGSGTPASISFQGIENTTDWTISIPAHTSAPYWIMFGQPFNHDTPCADVRFSSIPSYPALETWETAYNHGIVESAAQTYDYQSHSFLTVGPPVFLVERNRLQPWYGYWLLVRTTEPVTITIPAAP